MFPDVYDYDRANEMAATRSERQEGLTPISDLTCYFHEYARQKPEAVALGCFAIGFVLGWKLKPW